MNVKIGPVIFTKNCDITKKKGCMIDKCEVKLRKSPNLILKMSLIHTYYLIKQQ